MYVYVMQVLRVMNWARRNVIGQFDKETPSAPEASRPLPSTPPQWRHNRSAHAASNDSKISNNSETNIVTNSETNIKLSNSIDANIHADINTVSESATAAVDERAASKPEVSVNMTGL